jgi:hypothetical protein
MLRAFYTKKCFSTIYILRKKINQNTINDTAKKILYFEKSNLGR